MNRNHIGSQNAFQRPFCFELASYSKVRFTANGLKYATIDRLCVDGCDERSCRPVQELFFLKGKLIDLNEARG